MDDRLILICREGFERVLREDLEQRLDDDGPPGAGALTAQAGYVDVRGPAARALRAVGMTRCIFARQWLDRPAWLAASTLCPLPPESADALLAPLAASARPWTVHAFGTTAEGDDSLTGAALTLEAELLGHARAAAPDLAARYAAPRAVEDPETLVLQLCLAPGGLWHATMKRRELLDPFPGGVHRKRFDPAAPSRSYLKIEEAFDVLGEEPRPNQRVVDLGAAPGGWSYAFLKRGCRVIAVDHGPLHIPAKLLRPGALQHVLQDGIPYTPPPQWLPVDWLASDMLIPPGRTLGMLRKWMDGRWLRRFVVNVKIPQDHPWSVIRPLEEYLGSLRGVTFRIRQLYHDRREVTMMGRMR